MTLHERCARIELLLLDVDGVLTDGSIIYHEGRSEIKAFHVRDGSGLNLWRRAGKRAAIISGRRSANVKMRALELGVRPVVQGAADKLPAFEELLRGQEISAERVCAIGDDVPDLPLLRRCGLAVAVADACPEAIADAHYVTRSPGGRGAVREVIERILQAQGIWQRLVQEYRV